MLSLMIVALVNAAAWYGLAALVGAQMTLITFAAICVATFGLLEYVHENGVGRVRR